MAAEELTPRQTEVARLLCNGYTTLEIGDVLHIAERTVNLHKNEMYAKLNVRNEKELIRVALFYEIIKVDELKFYGRDYYTRDMGNDKRAKRYEGVL